MALSLTSAKDHRYIDVNETLAFYSGRDLGVFFPFSLLLLVLGAITA